MTMRSILLTSLASSAILIATSASTLASVIVAQDAAAPTDNVFASYGGSTSSLNWNGYGNSSDGWRDIGQTFKATDGLQLSAFTLKLISFGAQAQSAGFTITIYETTGANTKFTAGTLLSTQQGTLPTELHENQYITFTLDEAITLTPNRFYTIYLHFDNYASGTSETWRQITFARGKVLANENPLGTGAYHWLRPSPFTDAARAIDSGSQSGDVLAIALHGVATIPEPGAASLLIGMAGAAGLCRWRFGKTRRQ